jgi:cytochrome oxidase assembly protein ShyY1
VSDRFWLRPKWIAGHILAIVLVVSFVNLGFWQLRRLHEKQRRNATIEARTTLPPEPVDRLTGPASSMEFRRVSVRGTYDEAASVLVKSRSLDGQAGFWVATPMLLDDGRAVEVVRGFAQFTDLPSTDVFNSMPPPSGTVTVTGLAMLSQHRGSFGPRDPNTGTLTQVVRVDLGRIQQQYPRKLLPVWVQLQTQTPPQRNGFPKLLPPPERSEGPHRSYAIQWFIFATVGAVGWPILLYRTAQERPA